MPDYNAADVSALLEEANEQVHVYDSGKDYVEFYGVPITLQTPEDWVAWLLHGADLREQMALQHRNDIDRADDWQDAALMRKYAIALIRKGVQPAEIEWKENFK